MMEDFDLTLRVTSIPAVHSHMTNIYSSTSSCEHVFVPEWNKKKLFISLKISII